MCAWRTTAASRSLPRTGSTLLDGVWSSNPVRVTPEEAARRLAKKAPRQRWRGLRVM
ncbi:MAG TPA: hypothetical protein VFU93_14805 [Acidimicrobiales bacterium]|nr:hypothetical protein [Acidimicrobiales bacterium]